MWLVLRLLMLVGVYLWKFFWRRQSVGEVDEFRGVPAARKVLRHKGRFRRAYLGLAYPGPLHFQFSTERGWDTFFKNLGLAAEQQTDDRGFDERVYITCDQPALGAMLRNRPQIRQALLALLNGNVDRVFADGAYVWAQTAEENHDPAAIRAALFELRQGLMEVSPEQLRSRRDAFFWKAVAVESLVWSIACYGIPGFVEFSWTRHTVYLDVMPIVKTGLFWSAIVFTSLFAGVALLFRGSSRGHRILVECFFLLLIGVPLSTVQAVSDVNIHLDTQPALLTVSRVRDQTIEVRRTRRSKTTHYYLHLEAVPGEHQPVAGKVEVEAWVYGNSRRGSDVSVRWHRGRIGVPWIESITPR